MIVPGVPAIRRMFTYAGLLIIVPIFVFAIANYEATPALGVSTVADVVAYQKKAEETLAQIYRNYTLPIGIPTLAKRCQFRYGLLFKGGPMGGPPGISQLGRVLINRQPNADLDAQPNVRHWG